MADKGDALKQKLIQRAIAASTLAGVELRTQLREGTPKDTGRTSRQWYVTAPRWSGRTVSFHIKHPFTGESPALSPRVEWLNEGTKPHPISSKSGKTLVFPGQYSAMAGTFPTRTAGALVFVSPKRQPVNHPGTKGTGFIDAVLKEQNVHEVFRRAFAATP